MQRRSGSDAVSSTSTFVGRGAELASLAVFLEKARLVTLLGPGGMGKTRLAMRYGEALRERGGEVCFVDLSECSNATGALDAVARALKATVSGLAGDVVGEVIGVRLAGLGRVLLILDNFEQLMDAAQWVVAWLRVAPRLQVLLTSRRALDVAGEQVLPLEPLRLEEAVDLFIGRAHAARPSAPLDRALVGEIVDAIDCMPLAIELAASHARVLSLEELRGRLARPLALLRAHPPEGRHGSVRRAVLDSLELLAPKERRLFVLLSTLRDGFALRDAEVILAAVFSAEETLDGIDALVRTSLLRVHIEPSAPARFGYFETIRQVAEELVDEGRSDVLEAHARHFAEEAARTAGCEEAALSNALLAHATSVRLAAERASLAHAMDALALASAMAALLSPRGRSALREELFASTLRALEAAEGAADACATAHLGRGVARRELGETELARADFELALSLAEEDSLRAVTLTRLAAIDDVMSDTERARARLEQALALLAQLPPSALRSAREAEASLQLGHAYRREGRLLEAETFVRAASAHYQALGDDEGWAAALYEHAVIDLFAGRDQAALDHVDQGLPVARRGHVRWMEGTLNMARGCLLHERGELGQARAHHADAAQLFESLGSRHREASARYYLASTLIEAREPTEALGSLMRARACIATVGSPHYEALIAACAATAHALLNRADEAMHELSLAEAALVRVVKEPALRAALAVHRLIVNVLVHAQDHAAACIDAEALVAASPNDDSRFALRVLHGLRGEVRAARDVLVVWPDARAFQSPGSSERVALPERSPLRRLLAHLVARRVEAPGEVVSLEALISAGWPAERMQSEAALNRVYVAIATLRKRGLGDVLERVEGGYRIAPGVVMQHEIKAR